MATVFKIEACSKVEKDEDVRVDMMAPIKDSPGGRPIIQSQHIYGSDDDQAAHIMEQLAREAKDKFNVTIEVDTAGSEGYKTKIKAAATANKFPDIFYTRGHELLRLAVDTGKVLEVSRYYSDDFQSHLNDAMMKGIQSNGGTYVLPLDSSMVMVYYNMEMTDRYDLEIPVTWDEFIRVCQTFVDNGITPMPVGGNEPQTITMYYNLLALREVGPEKVVDTATKWTDYSDPGFLEAARKLRQLVNMGAFTADSATALRERAEALFMQGQASMYLNDNWVSPRVYKESSRVAGKVKVAPFPVTGSGRSTIYDLTGGSGSAFAVGSSTKDLEFTVDLVEYMAMGLAVELYKCKSNNLPYINVDTGNVQLNPFIRGTHKYTDHVASYAIQWDNLLKGIDTARYLDSPEYLFREDITPEEFINHMNGLKQDETDSGRETGWK